MSNNIINSYTVDQEEYFVNVESIDESPSVIKAYFNKLMPNIKKGSWVSKIPINKSVLINDSSCSVDIPTVVEEQGYLTISHYPNEYPNFRRKAIEVSDNVWIVPSGNKFLAEIMHGDVNNIHFTGKV